MNLVFWQNIISPHQAPFIRELVDLGHDVLVVSTETISQDRQNLGWHAPSIRGATIILGPDVDNVIEIVRKSSPESIHIVAGARGTLLGKQAIEACSNASRRIGIISEAPDMRGIWGLLRWLKYTCERITVGRKFDFIFAMGQNGVRWFSRFGYPANKIFCFCYVTDCLKSDIRFKRRDTVRFLFVGRLISLKGVDILLKTLQIVESVEIYIIGDGPQNNDLQMLAQKCGISDRVYWFGQLSITEVQIQISKADVLILPSRKDGWGAVVNEALMLGTPVICSSACGASELIKYPWLGTVFKSGSIKSLANAMSKWRDQGQLSEQQRQRIRDWSHCIEAPLIAKYMEQVLFHVYSQGQRPNVPWR